VLAEPLRRPENPQVIDTEGLQEVELAQQTIAVATLGQGSEVAAVPHIGAKEVVRLTVSDELSSVDPYEVLDRAMGRTGTTDNEREPNHDTE
jgi:hypothetical protein